MGEVSTRLVSMLRSQYFRCTGLMPVTQGPRIPLAVKSRGSNKGDRQEFNPPRGLIIPWNPTVRSHVLIS